MSVKKMGAVTLTGDIFAICLLFSHGDLDSTLEEIVSRVERYQRDRDAHFGISRDDFRCLMIKLTWELEIGERFSLEIDNVKLRDVVPGIFDYHHAYFNDEGEHWIENNNSADMLEDFSRMSYWLDLNEKQYMEKMREQNRMKRFFGKRDAAAPSPEAARRFMEAWHITDEVLQRCSRPGDNS